MWILLGLAIAATRLFAASILELSAADEVDLVSLFGTEVRQVDILFAPIMLLLYLITGLGAKGALQTLMINRGFNESRASAKERKEQRRREGAGRLGNDIEQKTQRTKEAEEKRQAKLRETTEKKDARRKAEKEQFESNQPKAQQERQLKEARRQYFDDVKRYKQLETKFQSRYQRVSTLLAGLEGIDGDMTALMQARDNVLGVVDKSESGAQSPSGLPHSRSYAGVHR